MERHFRIFKPYGYLSQFITNQRTRRNKKLLGELFDFPEGTMSIGRLDEDSEGLLLLTTNGKVSAEITGRKVEKEYFVQVDGKITPEAVALLRDGVEIGLEGKKYMTKPGKAEIISSPPSFPPRQKPIRDERHGPTSWIAVTIREGKFRQVKKMTAAVGFHTLRLVRVRIGKEMLGSMEMGEVQEVKEFIL